MEADLWPDVRIGQYGDLPFAIFRYDPREELDLRSQVDMLAARLENLGKEVKVLSLARFLWDILETVFASDLGQFFASEQTGPGGLEKAVQTVAQVLDDVEPLDQRIADQLHPMNPSETVVFLVRASALFPFYRMSALLERLAGRGVQVPVVLFYPGTLDGTTGLSFMGVFEPDHTGYRYRIY